MWHFNQMKRFFKNLTISLGEWRLDLITVQFWTYKKCALFLVVSQKVFQFLFLRTNKATNNRWTWIDSLMKWWNFYNENLGKTTGTESPGPVPPVPAVLSLYPAAPLTVMPGTMVTLPRSPSPSVPDNDCWEPRGVCRRDRVNQIWSTNNGVFINASPQKRLLLLNLERITMINRAS